MKVMKRETLQKVGRRCRAVCWGTLFFALAAGLGACSDDDDGGGGEEEQSGVSSVLIGSASANMPVPGTVVAQYADSPRGMEINKLVDNNVTTSYETKHSSFSVTYQANEAVLANF